MLRSSEMNVVVLIGRLVADPELKYTPSGVAVATLRIAVDRRQKSETGEKLSDFFTVVAWRQSAEFAANYLTKGRLISVQGRMQQRSWVQQDGQKRSVVEVVADNLQGLDRPKESQQAPAAHGIPEYSGGDASMSGPEVDMDYDPFSGE
jgi:single-strand DNA-binding protein